MGHRSSLPVFIAPTARANLGHPDGELCLARAAARYNIIYAVSSYASVGHAEIAEEFVREGAALIPATVRSGQGALAFQRYLPQDKKRVLTADTPVLGKREDDERFQAELEVGSSDNAGVINVPRQAEPGGDAPVLRGSTHLHWTGTIFLG
ncbi:FMN-dependent dehydrogenase-domain-containing protein [Aspergillus desertorum]